MGPDTPSSSLGLLFWFSSSVSDSSYLSGNPRALLPAPKDLLSGSCSSSCTPEPSRSVQVRSPGQRVTGHSPPCPETDSGGLGCGQGLHVGTAQLEFSCRRCRRSQSEMQDSPLDALFQSPHCHGSQNIKRLSMFPSRPVLPSLGGISSLLNPRISANSFSCMEPLVSSSPRSSSCAPHTTPILVPTPVLHPPICTKHLPHAQLWAEGHRFEVNIR